MTPFEYGCRRPEPPGREGPHLFLQVNQTIPPPALMDYFVPIPEPGTGRASSRGSSGTQTGRPRAGALPRMNELIERGIIRIGDELAIVGMEDVIGRVEDASNVRFNDEILPYNVWAARQRGWSAINIYNYLVHRPTGSTLDDLRRNMPREEALDESNPDGGRPDPPPTG